MTMYAEERQQAIAQLVTQIEQLEQELNAHFERHPDAKILRSQPGLGPVLAARVLDTLHVEPLDEHIGRVVIQITSTGRRERVGERARHGIPRTARHPLRACG